MRYLIIIAALFIPTLATAEMMVCSTSAYVSYDASKGLEKYDIEADVKTYISITDNILAMNDSDDAAALFKENSRHTNDILGLRNRKFISTDEYAADVVIVGGKECSFGDKEPREVNRSVTFLDTVFVRTLSCKCK